MIGMALVMKYMVGNLSRKARLRLKAERFNIKGVRGTSVLSI